MPRRRKKAAKPVEAPIEERAKPSDVPEGRLILEYLQRHPNSHASAVAQGTGLDQATVTRILEQRVVVA